MKTSAIWESEPSDRKEYITSKIAEVLNLQEGITKKEWENALRKLKSAPQYIDQQDLHYYLAGQQDFETVVKESYKRFNKFDTKDIEEMRKEQVTHYRYRKVKEKNYRKSLETTTGYYKGEKVVARAEEYLVKGEPRFRLRDSKGRFVSFSKQ